MEVTCESCGLPILEGERLSLFQTHHEPFVQCIRRLRAELELSKAAAEKNCTAWENTAKHFQEENERLRAIIVNAQDVIEEVQLIDNTPDEARRVRREMRAALDAAGGKE